MMGYSQTPHYSVAAKCSCWNNIIIQVCLCCITFRIQRSALLCWNHTVPTVVQYIWTIPGFPSSPKCLMQNILLTVLTHIPLHAHWKMCDISSTTLERRNRWRHSDRWPNPQQQMWKCSFNEVHFHVTCEILDEHTDCSRCMRCQ